MLRYVQSYWVEALDGTTQLPTGKRGSTTVMPSIGSRVSSRTRRAWRALNGSSPSRTGPTASRRRSSAVHSKKLSSAGIRWTTAGRRHDEGEPACTRSLRSPVSRRPSATPLAQIGGRGPHATLGAEVPGVDRYVQNLATASLGLVGIHDSLPAFDGYACVWFADRRTFRSSVASPQWSAIETDSSSLFDTDSSQLMTADVEEHVVVDGPMGPFKAVWFVQFTSEIRADPNLTHEAHQYWTRTHGGAFGVRVPGIDRYVQNQSVVEPTHKGVGKPGLTTASPNAGSQNRAAFDVTMQSEEWDEMNSDAKNIFDRDWIGRWMERARRRNCRQGRMIVAHFESMPEHSRRFHDLRDGASPRRERRS